MHTRDRVRQLIDDSGLTSKDFGERVDIEASKLSKSLKGVRNFTSLELAEIAEFAGVTVDWLLSGREDKFAAAARAARHGSSAAAALERAQALVSIRRSLSTFGMHQRWSLDRHEGLHGRRWIDQGEELARDVRGTLNAPVHEVADLASLIEDEFGVDVALADLGELDGLAVATDTALLIMATTSRPAARQRFTLMHELAHLLASDDQQLHQDVDIYAKGEGETRANAFAAEMLMPADELRARTENGLDQQGFAELVEGFMVSPSALAWKLRNEKLIDDEERTKWGALTAARCASMTGSYDAFAARMSSAAAERHPRKLLADALSAYRDGHTTLRLAATVMGTDSASLRAMLENEGTAHP